MTLPNELHPGFFSAAGGGDLGDPIEQSLRNSGSGQFYRSSFPIPSQWTASFWFKFGRGYLSTGGGGYAFSWHFSGTSYVICGLGIGYPASYTGSSSNGNCLVVCVNGLSTWSDINTAYQIRDPSAWYHHTIVSNAGTLTWYVNGKNIGNVTGVKTSGTSANFTIGGQAQSSSIQGYFADFHYIDGTNYAPTDFARTNEDGVWVPKTAEGITYGSNGFHMTFDSSQSNGIGHDSSGQGNHFTTSGYDTADVRLYSKDLYSMTTGSGNWATTTSKNWSSNTAATGFNGNLSDAVQVTTGDTWVWRPSYSLTATLVEVYPTNSSPNQKLYFNGTEVGGSYTGAAWNTVYTGSATTVNHIGGEFTGGGNGFYGIRVNGTVLVDNTDNDVDFFDTPTSNYATLNAILHPTNQTLTNANLTGGGNSAATSLTTQLPNYKYYWEGIGSNYYHGISEIDAVRDSYLGNRSDEVGWFRDGTFWVGASNVGTFGPSFTTTDVAMLAYDPASGKLWVGINGTWHGSGDPANGTNPAYTVGASIRETMVPASNVSANTVSYNFGQMPFIYTPPTGYKALQTNNFPNATIKDGSDHFQAITGSGAAGGSGGRQGSWTPDLFTAPPGTRAQAHVSTASVFQSGETGKLRAFDGNTATVAETAQSEGRPGWMSFRPSDTTLSGLTATSTFKVRIRRIAELWINGTQMTGTFTGEATTYDLSSQLTFPFTLESMEMGAISGQDAGLYFIELDGEYLIQEAILETAQAAFPTGAWLIHSRTDEGNDAQASQWQWLDSTRGGTTAITFPANTSGTSGNHMTTYAAPASDAFAYCWNAISPATNGFQIIQDNSPTTGNNVITHSLGKTPEFIFSKETNNSDYGNIYHTSIGTSGGLTTGGAVEHTNAFRVTSVSSTQFTIADSDSSNPQIHYVWTSIEGFSKFGEYNAATAFVYTGFKPALLWIKKTGVAEGWWTADNKRNDQNPVQIYTGLQQQGTETTSNGDRDIDFLSNGFKIRGTDSQISGAAQYVYMCWAESPFGGQNVPPATAR